MAPGSPKPFQQYRWLSHGTEQFEHDGILVKPAAVAFDGEQSQLVVVVRALSSDPSRQAPIDLSLARISAFVVAGSLEQTLPHFSVSLHLRYSGNIDVAVDALLAETAQEIEYRRQALRHRTHERKEQDARIIPGPLLAYVLSTLQRR